MPVCARKGAARKGAGGTGARARVRAQWCRGHGGTCPCAHARVKGARGRVPVRARKGPITFDGPTLARVVRVVLLF